MTKQEKTHKSYFHYDSEEYCLNYRDDNGTVEWKPMFCSKESGVHLTLHSIRKFFRNVPKIQFQKIFFSDDCIDCRSGRNNCRSLPFKSNQNYRRKIGTSVPSRHAFISHFLPVDQARDIRAHEFYTFVLADLASADVPLDKRFGLRHLVDFQVSALCTNEQNLAIYFVEIIKRPQKTQTDSSFTVCLRSGPSQWTCFSFRCSETIISNILITFQL